MDDFFKYEKFKQQGLTPRNVCSIAKEDGLDAFARIKMLRSVYKLSLSEAKEVYIQVETNSENLVEHQEKIIPGLKKIFKDDSKS